MRVEFEVVSGRAGNDPSWRVFDLPTLPQRGDDVDFYGTDYTVQSVSWIVNDEETYAVVTLR